VQNFRARTALLARRARRVTKIGSRSPSREGKWQQGILARRCAVAGLALFTLGFGPAAAVAQGGAQKAATLDPKVISAVDDLVAANRMLAKEGILPGYGHVSVRSPSNPNRILISRSMAPALVAPTDIVELDLDCNPIIPNGPQLYYERFLHCAIYKARPDVNAVVHAHTPYSVLFSTSTHKMKPVITGARIVGPDGPPIFDITAVQKGTNMLVSDMKLGKAMTDVMGNNAAVLLRGHGIAVAGPTIARAVDMIEDIEKNGKILAQSIAMGGPIDYVHPDDYTAGGADLNKIIMSENRGWAARKAQVMGCPDC
jgi:HCOMODA/2-hydroxy-3-carboxy-muconic semialdehyde decarboxylase